MADLVLHAGNVQYLFGNAGQSVGVLLHHVGQSLLAGVLQVFFQQRVGLDDGCQRVADFMRYSG